MDEPQSETGIESSSKSGIVNGTTDMDVDDMYLDSEDVMVNLKYVEQMNANTLRTFCRKASTAFFDEYGLVSHQINSYNEFIKDRLQNIFDSVGEIIVEPGFDPSKRVDVSDWRYASVKLGKVHLQSPEFWTGEKYSGDGGNDNLKMLPRHARLMNMTYSAKMVVETCIQVFTKKVVDAEKFKTGTSRYISKECEREIKTEIIIGRLPIMVGSDMCQMKGKLKDDCAFDNGGYFIIKGAEKTFIAQEQVCLSRLWISSNPTWMVSYRQVSKRKRVFMKLVDHENGFGGVGAHKFLSVYFLVAEMPVWILFFALGASNDKEVVDLIDLDIKDTRIANILLTSIYQADKACEGFRKDTMALQYVEKLMKNSKYPPTESVEECFSTYLFSNLKSFKQKIRFLGYMVKCLVEAFIGRRKPDNRDDFRNKRLELASDLLERELKVHLKHSERRMIKAMQRDLYGDKELHSLEHYIDSSIITNGLSRAFSTGAWSHPYKSMERVSGVVATLRRTNPLQAASDMRKTRQQVSYTGRVGDARYPHPSHWGKVCFLSTSDGENCGLVKNLASLGLVSTTVSKPLLDQLLDCGFKEMPEDASSLGEGEYKVFVNGNWIGTCEDSQSFVAELKRKRRNKEINQQVEIKRDALHHEVRVFSDSGRILRPLLVVGNLHRIYNLKGGEFMFQTLLDNGIIELIGPEEEEDIVAAWGTEFLLKGSKENPPLTYTHCELDSSFLLGLSCALIPYANHDHARRVLYQAEKHSQQAMGYYCTNPNIRADTNIHQLYYPQRPLFRTMLADCLGKSTYTRHKGMIPRPEFYNGQCAIVAVNVHKGFNQEDSIVMNRASLERGMFRTEHVRSYKSEVDEVDSSAKRGRSVDSVQFGKIQSKIGRVDSLDDDGFPYIGASLQTGDIVIGKYAYKKAMDGTVTETADHSVKLKHTERGMVQKVILSSNDDGKKFASVSLRQVRTPCMGDKFSSMHGQKGVLGYLESQENMNFTAEGVVPDIIINPHAFPSRQTPGQILEGALGKGIALGGILKHATPYSTLSADGIGDQLHSLGFQRWGEERVYNGTNGLMCKNLIFMGPTCYQRLTHMAEDKVKFRNTGPVHPLTRQPVADRKRFGGIKFGEMERDCLIAHGASANLHERLFTLSDCSEMHICRKCKCMANVYQRTVYNKPVRGPHCRICQSVEDIVKVSVPYGAKLLCQELFSMGITLKFNTELA